MINYLYIIIGIIFVVALFLIFRDDHDDSYNKKEKGARQSQQPKEQPKYSYSSGPKQEQPKTEKKASGPSWKDQLVGQIDEAIREAKKGAEEPLSMVREAMDKAKAAIDGAMQGAQNGWASSDSPDVDEQEQPEAWDLAEEPDLSFLDTLSYDESLEENTDTFDIAGLRYHCTAHDCGKVVGIVKPDPSNAHDPRAQAVVRADGKLLGYIPRAQLDWYEDFNEQNVPCPFVGEIELDRADARLVAEIKVILPSSRSFVEEEIQDEL